MPRPSAAVRVLALFALVGALGPAARAQAPDPAPVQSYPITSVAVEGALDASSESLVRSISGLRAGAQLRLPGDPAISQAIRNLYSRGGYSDVAIEVAEVAEGGVALVIRVEEDPRLGSYEIQGLRSGDRDEVRPQIPLLRGRAVRPADIERGSLAIETYLRAKGYRTPTVVTSRSVGEDGRLNVVYNVTRGDRQTVTDVRFSGNEEFSDRTLRKQLKNTPEERWWRFWKRETFDEAGFDDDLDALVRFYNDRGYYGARVVRDSVYTEPTADGGEDLIVEVEVEEGPKYHIRNVVFEGNTGYTDDQLALALGVRSGDVYDRSRLDQNLYYTEDNSDVTSLYQDRGYFTFNIVPSIVEAPGDSLDLSFEITEGDIYEFGDVRIAGNTRTKEHVIRRELRTVPGQPFSRTAIQRSVRELAQLNYFDPASFGAGPAIDVDDQDQTVDLVYNLAETSSDQLELSGGYGGANVGLILTASVTFTNFSLQNLLKGFDGGMPTGDGQQLSLRVQTYGTFSQVYSVSFTEPWFRGRPTPIGFSLSYQNLDYSNLNTARTGGYKVISGRTFYSQRLRFPDDFFQTGTSVGYRLFDIDGTNVSALPEGVSQELSISQSLTRNALDNPTFPQSGSNLGLTLTVAPPIADFIQYHKWDLNTAFYTPLLGKLTGSFRSQFGYIGSLTGDDVEFQRYVVGGTPLDASGNNRNGRGFGQDLVFLRGYPFQSVGPREGRIPVGGRILTKYEAELGIVLVQTPQLQFQPYVFADAANTYDSFDDFDPSRLFRSAGVGGRVFLPILGLVDINLGYQIDPYAPLELTPEGFEDAQPGWRFQFSLGGR